MEKLLTLKQIIGTKTEPGILPMSRSAWYANVKSGLFPSPVKLGNSRSAYWRYSDIQRLIQSAVPSRGERDTGPDIYRLIQSAK